MQLRRKPNPGEVLTSEYVTTGAMVAGNERWFTRVVICGVVYHWVGFGWIDTDDPVTPDLPVVKE